MLRGGVSIVKNVIARSVRLGETVEQGDSKGVRRRDGEQDTAPCCARVRFHIVPPRLGAARAVVGSQGNPALRASPPGGYWSEPEDDDPIPTPIQSPTLVLTDIGWPGRVIRGPRFVRALP